MTAHGRVLFLCPHNAAKSILAAAYFDQQASARGLPFRADSAGTDPDAHPSPAVVAALQDEGIDVTGHQPWRVTGEDLMNASRVISLGCELGDLPQSDRRVDQWDDVPPASRDLAAARDAIQRHVDELLDELAGDDQKRATYG